LPWHSPKSAKVMAESFSDIYTFLAVMSTHVT
jgi:hypothetical protein